MNEEEKILKNIFLAIQSMQGISPESRKTIVPQIEGLCKDLLGIPEMNDGNVREKIAGLIADAKDAALKKKAPVDDPDRLLDLRHSHGVLSRACAIARRAHKTK